MRKNVLSIIGPKTKGRASCSLPCQCKTKSYSTGSSQLRLRIGYFYHVCCTVPVHLAAKVFSDEPQRQHRPTRRQDHGGNLWVCGINENVLPVNDCCIVSDPEFNVLPIQGNRHLLCGRVPLHRSPQRLGNVPDWQECSAFQDYRWCVHHLWLTIDQICPIIYVKNNLCLPGCYSIQRLLCCLSVFRLPP